MYRVRARRQLLATLRPTLVLTLLLLCLSLPARVRGTGAEPGGAGAARAPESNAGQAAPLDAAHHGRGVAATSQVTDTEVLVLLQVARDWQSRVPACTTDVSVNGTTYGYVCNVAAGHSFRASIQRFWSEAAAGIAFDAARDGHDVGEFRGFRAAEWHYDEQPGNPNLPMRHRLHVWHADSWLFQVESFDDTVFAVAPTPSDVSEQVYQSAIAYSLFPLGPEGGALLRVAQAWREPAGVCPATILYEGPASYTFRCTVAPGHSVYAAIDRYATVADAAAAFARWSETAAVETFHGYASVSVEVDETAPPDPVVRTRHHIWQADRWLMRAALGDVEGAPGVPAASSPVEVSERIFEGAISQGLLVVAPASPPWLVEPASEMGGVVSAVAAEGRYAYVGFGGSLEIINISDPTHPTIARRDWMGALAEHVVVAGGRAYVAMGDAGLRIADVADPAWPPGPAWVSEWPAWDVAVIGTRAYVASGTGLRVLDVSDPLLPVEIAELETWGDVWGVFVSGGYAYLACSSAGMRVIDVRDPAAPAEVGQFDTYAGDVVVQGRHAYVATGDVLQVVDVTDPAAPAEVGSALVDAGGVDSVAVDGNVLYAGLTHGAVAVFDLADATKPAIVGMYAGHEDLSSGGVGPDLFVSAGLALVAGWETGLWVVDVSTPSAPREIAGYGVAFNGADARVRDGYAYVAAESGGLRVIDVSEPAAPFEVAKLGVQVDALCLSGSHVIAANAAQLLVVDVSRPVAPTLVGVTEIGISGWPGTMTAEDGYAYVTGYGDGLVVFDVRDPTQPSFAGAYNPGSRVYSIDVLDSRAYIVDGAALRVLDVSDPRRIRESSAYALPGEATRVRVADAVAYVTDADGGTLMALDVSDPVAPRLVGAVRANGSIMAVSDQVAFVAGAGGVGLVDVSVPTGPRELATYAEVGGAGAIAVIGSHMYLPIWRRGLVVLGFRQPPRYEAVYLPVACRACELGGERRPSPAVE